MLAVLVILVTTAACSRHVAVDGAPEMLRAMIGAPHLSRRAVKSRAFPDAMLALYAAQTDSKAPKSILQGATTVRSFTHKGNMIHA